MVAMLDVLLDEAADDESHALVGLVDIVGDLIEDYESDGSRTLDVHGNDGLWLAIVRQPIFSSKQREAWHRFEPAAT